MTAMTEKKQTLTTRKLVLMAIMGSLGGLLMLLEFPLPFAPSFMGVDLSDIPVMVSSISMGPIAGVITSVIKIFMKLMFKPTSTAFIGELSNLVLSIVIALTVGLIYKKKPTHKGLVIGVIATIFTMSAVALITNSLFIYPAYVNILGFNMSDLVAWTNSVNFLVHDYWTMMFFMVVPFNLVKQSFVAIITLLLFRYVEPIVTKQIK